MARISMIVHGGAWAIPDKLAQVPQCVNSSYRA